jgi:hypothetical protein
MLGRRTFERPNQSSSSSGPTNTGTGSVAPNVSAPRRPTAATSSSTPAVLDTRLVSPPEAGYESDQQRGGDGEELGDVVAPSAGDASPTKCYGAGSTRSTPQCSE